MHLVTFSATPQPGARRCSRWLPAMMVIIARGGQLQGIVERGCSVKIACASVRRLFQYRSSGTVCRPLVAAEGWESGSPKLRIITQKKLRQRNVQGSDGPSSDFYSPLSSFHNSPLAGMPCLRVFPLLQLLWHDGQACLSTQHAVQAPHSARKGFSPLRDQIRGGPLLIFVSCTQSCKQLSSLNGYLVWQEREREIYFKSHISL